MQNGYFFFFATVVLTSTLAFQDWPLTGSCFPCDCRIHQGDYGRVKYVNCSRRSLQTVPRDLPKDTHTLDISYNELSTETLKDLCTLSSMELLDVAFNNLESFPVGCLGNCSHLLSVNLTGNTFKRLFKGSFNGLENLREMHGLQVNAIDTDVFKSLQKLKTLELIYNGETIAADMFDGLPLQDLKLVAENTKILPSNLFDFGVKTLNDLLIIGKNIEIISENSFRGLAVLRKIYLDLKGLRILPERIFHNNGGNGLSISKPQNLREIWIFNIEGLPNEIFKGLENLNKLVLKNIKYFPTASVFNDLLNMEYLDITACGLNSVPIDWFNNLFSLKTLKLRQTGVRSLEMGALSGLLNLQELDLSYNVLRSIRAESLDVVVYSIKKINLQGNLLKEIDNKIFQKMYNLVSLDISDNKLDSIAKDAFKDLGRLIFLNIHDNKLSNLPDSVLDNLTNLQHIDLSMNTLTTFPVALSKPGYLFKIDLSDNRISRLPKDLFSTFPYLELLNLQNNPLFCECDNFKPTSLRSKLKILGTCIFPDIYTGKTIDELRQRDCMGNIVVSSTFFTLETTEQYSMTTYNAFIPSILFTAINNQSSNFTEQKHKNLSVNFSDINPSTTLMYYVDISTTDSSVYLEEESKTTQVQTNPIDDLITSHSPPIVKAEKGEEVFIDNLVFRISVGVLVGTVFICGIIAIVLWRKRIKQRKRYEVTESSTVV